MHVEASAKGTIVGILIFDGVEELDFVGPWEVFGSARECGANLTALTVAATSGVVCCAHGLHVIADCAFEASPRLDLLVIPGGYGTRRAANDEATLEWIRAAAPSCQWVASVCTGARLLAQSGLTAGRRMTTHWSVLDELAMRADIEIVRDARYVTDGKYVSAAGISAGIDMSLWLVGQRFGERMARDTQTYMEYDPVPPYDVSEQLRRSRVASRRG